MGQQVGKASIVENVQPFVNLPRVACQRLWESFHDVAEGFGLQLDELQEICYVLDRVMATEKDQLDVLVEGLFRILDTDENGVLEREEARAYCTKLLGRSPSPQEFDYFMETSRLGGVISLHAFLTHVIGEGWTVDGAPWSGLQITASVWGKHRREFD